MFEKTLHITCPICKDTFSLKEISDSRILTFLENLHHCPKCKNPFPEKAYTYCNYYITIKKA